MSENTASASVVVPSVEETLSAFRALDAKGRRAMIAGLKDRAMSTFIAGETVIAESYAELVRAVTAPDAGTDADLEAATRYVTFRAVTEALEAALSDRARSIAVTREPNPELRARLEGTLAARRARSTDGATRVGSNEPKGSIPMHMLDALKSRPGAWMSTAMIADHKSDGFGYTDTFRPRASAVTASLESTAKDNVAWRAEHRIEVGHAPVGRNGKMVLAARIAPRPAPRKKA